MYAKIEIKMQNENKNVNFTGQMLSSNIKFMNFEVFQIHRTFNLIRVQFLFKHILDFKLKILFFLYLSLSCHLYAEKRRITS